MEIPYVFKGGSGPLLHFAHANGYPPQSYELFLNSLCQFASVYAMEMRPLWRDCSPESVNDWGILADDLIKFLESRNTRPWIGIGHSLGGTITLLAALQKPSLFTALIIIDPAFFPEVLSYIWLFISKIKFLQKNHPLSKAALRRRRVFENQDKMFQSYRKKEVFKGISDEGLSAYVNGLGYYSQKGDFALRYTPEWESRIYLTSRLKDHYIWKNLSQLKPPVMFIRGGNTNTFWPGTVKRIQKILPTARMVQISNGTHLVPLEKPGPVADIINQFIHTKILDP